LTDSANLASNENVTLPKMSLRRILCGSSV